MTCPVGGGVDRRHDHVRDALAEWLRSLGRSAHREQYVPKWDKPESRARLDIATLDSRQGVVHVDIALTDSVFPGATNRVMRATERREK